MLSKLGLKTVVFDDFFEEAEPLIKGLDSERIPNIFINFNYAEDEYKPLTNIRMVFADIFIEKNKSVDGIAAAINDHITENNGPFILVAWTKHPDYLDKLIERLDSYPKNLTFISLSLDKNDYFESEQGQDNYADSQYEFIDGKSFDNIREDINKKLEEKLGFLPLFLEWEMNQSKSISKVMDLFFEFPNEEEKTKQYLAGLLVASLGKSMSTIGIYEKQKAFFEILNTIINDEFSSLSSSISKFDKIEYKDYKKLDEEKITSLNTKLLFTSAPSDSSNSHPGNVFDIKKIISFNDDIKNLFDSHYTILVDEVVKDCKQEIEKRIKELSIPVLLEMTPYCDFAQNKQKKIKFVLGYLFPFEYNAKILSKTEYLYLSENFSYDNKNYRLILNYRYTISVSINDFDEHITNGSEDKFLLLRVRKEMLNHIQHRYAYFSSRPGVTAI